MNSKVVPNVKKIVVLRANMIGDFVFVLPALQALRETYPEAEITLVVRKWAIEFLKNRPGPFDKVVEMPSFPVINPGVVDEKKLDEFFEKMRAEKFDLAFQLQGGGRESNSFINNFEAKYTFGSKTPDAENLDYWIPYIHLQNEISRNLEVVAQAGAEGVSQPKLEVMGQDIKKSYKSLPAKINDFVVLHPGATDPRRRWPAKRFAEVADYIESLGFKVVIIGSGDEKRYVKVIKDWMETEPILLVGKLNLNELLGIIERAKLLVGSDSGPRHLAEAVGTANVGLYWLFNIVNGGPVTRALNRPLISVQTHCPFCGFNYTDYGYEVKSCNHTMSLISKISVKQVKEQILEILSLRKENLGFNNLEIR